MKKATFWSEASRYGAILGGVEILLALFKSLAVNSTWLAMGLSAFGLWCTITLLYRFTKRRSMLYGADEGYSYGNGLKFILSLSLFSGVVLGAYEIFARNILFVKLYREAINLQLLALKQSPMLTQQLPLAEVKEMAEMIMFSPIWVVLSTIFGLMLSYLFYGLFIAAFTRREANIFTSQE